MTTSIVTIGGESATIWGTTTAANTHLLTDGTYRTAWSAASTDTRALKLVSATRVLDRLVWKDGVTPHDEADVLAAVYELAGTLLINPAILGGPGGGSAARGAVRSVSDGQQRVDFTVTERAARAGLTTRFGLPRDILQLIRPYLARNVSETPAGSYVTGTDGESIMDESDDQFLMLEGL